MPINFSQDHDPLAGDALAAHIETALRSEPLHGRELELAYRAIKLLFRPQILHAERIPGQPCLFVGNHSLFALDGLVIGPLLLKELGRGPRPMGDKFLWSNRQLGDALLARGAVMGHPAVCEALMVAGEDLLVFPGGAHEAVKPASARYELQWKERYGFVRLAARHGYTIMPFGLVGPDEFYEHLIEGADLPDSHLGTLLRRLGLLAKDTRTDMLPPVPRGSLGTLLPRPQRCFLGFGEPVDLSAYRGRTPTAAQQRKLRNQVAEQIEQQLAELLRVREQQRSQDSFLRRLLTL